MQLYSCGCCGNQLYFENVLCQRCGATLGFLPDQLNLVALEKVDNDLWRPIGPTYSPRLYRMCPNYNQYHVCNWMVAADDHESFCVACRLNHTIPNLSVPVNYTYWQKLETEKRRLIYGLLRLKLPVVPKTQDPAGLAFDFLADAPTFSERGRVMTGHAKGLITLNIAEADPVVRERMRTQMDEPYRTIVGHFRHESGHYYWDRLIRNTTWLDAFRALFGDERLDYKLALENHYQNGPPVDWQNQFVSAYASCHPWEDWAESWAHYLHIVDTLETANQFGLRLQIPNQAGVQQSSLHYFNSYEQENFQPLMDNWFPLTFALNSLNRSMGYEALYPFILSAPVQEKLRFVHEVVHAYRSQHLFG